MAVLRIHLLYVYFVAFGLIAWPMAGSVTMEAGANGWTLAVADVSGRTELLPLSTPTPQLWFKEEKMFISTDFGSMTGFPLTVVTAKHNTSNKLIHTQTLHLQLTLNRTFVVCFETS